MGTLLRQECSGWCQPNHPHLPT